MMLANRHCHPIKSPHQANASHSESQLKASVRKPILVCPLVWFYRGFSEERQEKRLEKDDKDTEYDKLLEELNAGGLDLTRVSKKLTPYGPI